MHQDLHGDPSLCGDIVPYGSEDHACNLVTDCQTSIRGHISQHICAARAPTTHRHPSGAVMLRMRRCNSMSDALHGAAAAGDGPAAGALPGAGR